MSAGRRRCVGVKGNDHEAIEEYKGAAPALSSEESFRQHSLCQERLDRGGDDLKTEAFSQQRISQPISQAVIRRFRFS